MSAKSPMLDDLAGLMTGAMGAARAAGEEVKTAGQSRVRAMIADMDLDQAKQSIRITFLDKPYIDFCYS